MREANTGKTASKEARTKMSEAQAAGDAAASRGGVPWTAEEDALLGTMKDKEVAARTGRTEDAVSDRRYDLGVPAFVSGRLTANRSSGRLPRSGCSARCPIRIGSAVAVFAHDGVVVAQAARDTAHRESRIEL
jgi:hypothetical protein